jgi:hypothetical protein
MTARLRRGTRRRKPHDVSAGLAAICCQRLTFVGTISDDLLGQGRVREMVAVALFLGLQPGSPLSRVATCYRTVILQLHTEEEHG